MRPVPPALAAHLDGRATTLCQCWSLTRRDGAVAGFTDHDRPLAFEGVVFTPVNGVEAAERTAELGFAIGGGEIAGGLAATGLDEGAIARGLYDDARLALWLVNWAAPEERMLVETGFVGEIKRGEHAFTAEIRSLAKAFDDERGRLYLRSCAADLGDASCGVALVPVSGFVAETDGRTTLSSAVLAGEADDHFGRGRLTFTAGANPGFSSEVKRHASAGGVGAIQLWQAPPRPIAVGDAFQVTPGCDKSFTTCRRKFDNATNFRGFPHLPQNDFIAGGLNGLSGPFDGGSLFR